jgi:zinc protease
VPSVEKRMGEAGLDLRVVRLPRLPVVTAAFVLPAGEVGLAGERAGLAVLTANALEGGTKRRSGTALAEALEAVGADVSVDATWDATLASVSCLADRLPEALDLLAEMILAPAFPEGEVERARDQALARIRHRAKDPSALASDRAAALFYAEGEPYGRPAGGTEASVAGLGASDLAAFARGRYRPRGAGLVVTGDVDADEVDALAGGLLAGWDGAAPVTRPVAGAPRHPVRTVHVIHRAGSVQSELRIGHPGVARSTPDYPALVVANAILGGMFTSRLNMNLRETRGFTSGVRSGFAFRRGPGPFSVRTAVDTGVTAEAVAEAVREVTRFVEAGPTQAEVEAARDYVAGVFPLRLETTGQVAGRVAELVVHGLPDDAWTRYRDEIRAIDVASASAAFARHVRPAALTVVVVGDAEQVRAPLEALELGPVEVHDA